MSFPHFFLIGSRKKGSMKHHILNAAAAKLESSGQILKIHIRFQGKLLGNTLPPKQKPVLIIRKIKFQANANPSLKGRIHILGKIGGQNHHSRVFLHVLQHIGSLHVAVFVMAVLYLGPPAKQHICLVKK